MLLGKRDEHHLKLRHASISRLHAIFEIKHMNGSAFQSDLSNAVCSFQRVDLFLSDTGSTNGTFVNDQLLTPKVPRLIRLGDIIRFGFSERTYVATL